MCDPLHSSPSNEASSNLPRRDFFKMAGAAAMGLIVPGAIGTAAEPATPPKPQNALSPDAALERLLKGNKRYISGVTKRHDFQAERPALALGQNPFAGILSCADSRIAPEYAFDTGRGDLFVCRVAGNVASKELIASFEYGVAVLSVPLIMVLGHGKCGAVASAIKEVKDNAQFPGHIPRLLKAIDPAVKAVLHQPGDLLVNATIENVVRNVATLKKATPVLEEAVAAGRLKVVGGVYDLETGRVNLIA